MSFFAVVINFLTVTVQDQQQSDLPRVDSPRGFALVVDIDVDVEGVFDDVFGEVHAMPCYAAV
jgi:hypothetical protein